MTKFTPGPWAISNEPSAYMDGNIVSAGDHEVAGVWTLPDAHLIAKAPEMYEALKNFVECWSDETGLSNPYHSDVNKARAILAEINQ